MQIVRRLLYPHALDTTLMYFLLLCCLPMRREAAFDACSPDKSAYFVSIQISRAVSDS